MYSVVRALYEEYDFYLEQYEQGNNIELKLLDTDKGRRTPKLMICGILKI